MFRFYICLVSQIEIAQVPEYKGIAWILKRLNFAYAGGRCVINGFSEDIQRPLYQEGGFCKAVRGKMFRNLVFKIANFKEKISL